MSVLSTGFTERFAVPYPFVCAGMAFAGATPDLAVAVCDAGGVGGAGAALMPPDTLRQVIHAAQSHGPRCEAVS
ncbi:hypothetical protein ABZ916_36865 [Streptomyces sp. NPDC046853]|uniref:hypothetical protein n=1 Tax=Streptomyces sp. NPDC046853 TaxID=3154920 RepID=UPI0033FCD199